MDMSTKLVGDFCVACMITVVVILSVITALTMVWVMIIGELF